MQALELLRQGEHMMTVCNACRYCEQYCPVFPAMEERLTFGKADLTYLANLCHNCGECLYACQYAPPHEFGINVPKALAEIRLYSYEEYCWPRALGGAFRRQGIPTALGLTLGLAAVMFASALAFGTGSLSQEDGSGDFYAVVPHTTMVTLFSGVSLFVLLAFAIALRRFWRDVDQHGPDKVRATDDMVRATDVPDTRGTNPLGQHGATVRGTNPLGQHGATVRGTNPPGFVRSSPPGFVRSNPLGFVSLKRALRDVLTLRHLHGGGVDCTSGEETRTPWRRWFHHFTFYGFMLCFASTTVAAIYHSVFGWVAPHAYTSLPVILGTLGGVGLVVGPAGLLAVRRRRDPAISAPDQHGLDEAFIMLLFLTSLTGLALLVLRHQASMGTLLIVHLATVLALFLTLPYGKFVHGLYRAAALIKYAAETKRP